MTRIHLITTVKNEGPYLVEWVAWHRMIGVTDITVFSNDCSDGTNLMLNRMEALGYLRHFDNPIGPGMDPQRRAYWRANRMETIRAADWALILDADEFLNIHTDDGTIDSLIQACGAPDAISVVWRIFGSSGLSTWVDHPVTERFTQASSLEHPERGLFRGFKTLFRPHVFDFFGVHRPRFDKKKREVFPSVHWTNGSGAQLPDQIVEKGWGFKSGTMGYAHAQVNHYAVKSREEFLLKRLRGTANSKDKARIDLDYWEKLDVNTQADRTIRTEGLKAEMAHILKDADLAALQRAAIDSGRRTITDQMQEPELRAFVSGQMPQAAE